MQKIAKRTWASCCFSSLGSVYVLLHSYYSSLGSVHVNVVSECHDHAATTLRTWHDIVTTLAFCYMCCQHVVGGLRESQKITSKFNVFLLAITATLRRQEQQVSPRLHTSATMRQVSPRLLSPAQQPGASYIAAHFQRVDKSKTRLDCTSPSTSIRHITFCRDSSAARRSRASAGRSRASAATSMYSTMLCQPFQNQAGNHQRDINGSFRTRSFLSKRSCMPCSQRWSQDTAWLPCWTIGCSCSVMLLQSKRFGACWQRTIVVNTSLTAETYGVGKGRMLRVGPPTETLPEKTGCIRNIATTIVRTRRHRNIKRYILL